ncbi:NAD(+) diphosphatase [Deinococcus knuensis]|uniref:NAD(+) diphosphatase n=1 Tax=Deinococcus knuensis TaxID=1837380 RepID=A0ABQ2SEG0_9DEIO|nr:NAD(+) diphosphatase [Deinococcus knuensis]GGS23506.1 NADH pyrophosphatase [Deinococcus knuensis]
MNATSLPDGFQRDPHAAPGPDSVWFVFDGHRLILTEQQALPTGPAAPLPVTDTSGLGSLNGRTMFTAALDRGALGTAALEGGLPGGYVSVPVRSAFGTLGDTLMGVAGYASQILEFHRTHRYCGRCATPMQDSAHERSRVCPNCGLSAYPRVAPVAMVLITRGSGPDTEVLLARGPNFPPGMYSAIAGFAEPSETLEAAAHREVAEEVGVTVTDLRYAFSQPWPFPHSLMIGFTARYQGGQITPQPGEIEDARFFPVTALPGLPPRVSIARALIDQAVQAALAAG